MHTSNVIRVDFLANIVAQARLLALAACIWVPSLPSWHWGLAYVRVHDHLFACSPACLLVGPLASLPTLPAVRVLFAASLVSLLPFSSHVCLPVMFTCPWTSALARMRALACVVSTCPPARLSACLPCSRTGCAQHSGEAPGVHILDCVLLCARLLACLLARLHACLSRMLSSAWAKRCDIEKQS